MKMISFHLYIELSIDAALCQGLYRFVVYDCPFVLTICLMSYQVSTIVTMRALQILLLCCLATLLVLPSIERSTVPICLRE